MVSHVLDAMFSSDDPIMFHTDIAKQQVDPYRALSHRPETVRAVPERF